MQQFIFFLSEINLFLDQMHSLDFICDNLKDIITEAKEEDPILKKLSKGRTRKEGDKPTEYSNFCVWALSLGFVLPVGEDHSTITFANKSYSFHSQEAIKQFQKDPQRTLLDIVRVMYDNPDLMIFLEKGDEFT